MLEGGEIVEPEEDAAERLSEYSPRNSPMGRSRISSLPFHCR